MTDDASGEEALREVRRAKAARVRERGANPFANDVDTAGRTEIRALRAEYAGALLEPASAERYSPERVLELSAGKTYGVLGRILSRRGFGKASFLTIRDGSGELQLFAKQDVMGLAFEALSEVDIADHVEARGSVMVTRTGELSLEVQALRLVSKALRPLPDKYHGLVDVDLRHRHRYVDLIANPEVRDVFVGRAAIVRELRAFLESHGFLEFETPSLHTLVGGAAARPFVTHHNALELELFLRIAPELYLKRLLVGGFERVFEVARCYRNEGISTRHNPEFTMLEFYQAYATYDTLMDLVEPMLRHVDAELARAMAGRGAGDRYSAWRESRCFTLDEPFQRLPMRAGLSESLERASLPEAVLERLEALGAGAATEPADPRADDWVREWRGRSERARRVDWHNLRRALAGCDSEGERVFVAYEYLVEPFLSEDFRSAEGAKSRPVFVVDYPAEVSPLARRKDADPRLVDRFELFVDGLELCNGFSELNDPEDQAERFREQLERKRRGDAETMDYDADYIRALEHGMPPAAGFGLGIDRLAMVLMAQPSIRDVVSFPLLRPETGE